MHRKKGKDVSHLKYRICLKKVKNTKQLFSPLSPSTVGAIRLNLVRNWYSLALGWWERDECRNSSSLRRMEEENLEELGNKFLYQECAVCPVHSPETSCYFGALFIVWDECE